MSVTRLQLGLALLIAMLLHGSALLWMDASPERAPEPTPAPLRIILDAPIALATAAPPAEIAEPPAEKPRESTPQPKPKPKPKPKPEPAVEPRPAPEPVVPKAVAEPSPPAPPATETPRHTPPPTPPESIAPQVDETAVAQYEHLLLSRLERYKRYPRRAKRLRIEGEGRVRIRIGRDGSLFHVSLEHSTGNRLLDRAALEMVRRASPFPPFPHQDSRPEREFLLPVAFLLQ